MMTAEYTYFAYGRIGEHEGFDFLVKPPSADLEQDRLLRCVSGFQFPPPRPRAAAPTAGMPASFDLEGAVVICLPTGPAAPTLLVNRPQKGLTRSGMLTEGVRFGAGGAAGRPMRVIEAFSPQPAVEAVRRTGRDFASRAAAVRSAQPLRKLLSAGNADLDTFRRFLSASLAAIADRADDRTVVLLLPPDRAHMALPVARAIDEILPPADKARGFAVVASPVATAGADVCRQFDWVIVSAEPRAALFDDLAGLALCDLRGPDTPAVPLAGEVEALLAAGAPAAEAFGQWLARRPEQSIASLPPGFWQRLRVHLAGRRHGPVAPAEMLEMLGEQGWTALDLPQFLRLWHDLTGRGGDAAAAGAVVARLAGHVGLCPPLLGWLLHHDVLAAGVDAAVARALATAMPATPPTDKR